MIRPLVQVRGAASDLTSDGRGFILLSVASGWFLSLGVRLVYPVLIPYLRVDFGLSLGTAGLLLTVLWFAYAVGQLPAGILTDRIGEKLTLVGSTVISAILLFFIFFTSTWLVLLLATILYGLGTALYGVARFTIMSAIYPNRDGLAIGFTMAAGQLGNSILPPVAGLLAGAFTWQFGFGFAIPLFLSVALALWISVPDTGLKTNAVDSLALDTFLYVLSGLKRRSIMTVFFIQVLTVSVWQAFVGFYPTYLIEGKGVSATFATIMFGMFFAVGVVAQLGAGSAYDRWGIRRSLPAVLGIPLVGFVFLPGAAGRPELVVVTLLVSGISGYGTITMAYLTREMPADMEGTGLGFLRTGYIMVGAVSPFLFGTLADRGYFDEAFYLLAVLTALAILVCVALPRRLTGGW